MEKKATNNTKDKKTKGKNKSRNRFIALIVVLGIIIGAIVILDRVNPSVTGLATLNPDNSIVNSEIKDGKYSKSPELEGISGYLNTDGEEIKIEDYRGKVVLIDFWTYTCINCIRTLPYLTSWDEKYNENGLVIIGVHTPEFEFEKKYENVQDAIDKYDIKYAVVQDNDYRTWGAFQNRYWPRKYLIDSEGFIRYDHIGEGGYEETEKIIQELLDEIDQDVDHIEIEEEEIVYRQETTPELFAGYKFALSRGQNIGNDGGLRPGEVFQYGIPTDVQLNQIYLAGEWESLPDNLRTTGEAGAVILGFVGKEVNIVADSEITEIVELEVFINGQYIKEEQAGIDVSFEGEKAIIIIEKPRLYNIFEGDYDVYGLELISSNGFSFNAFTFG